MDLLLIHNDREMAAFRLLDANEIVDAAFYLTLGAIAVAFALSFGSAQVRK